MLALSKAWLARHGITLVQKENGDVLLEEDESQQHIVRENAKLTHERLAELYPDVDHDVLLGVAYKAYESASIQQLVVTIGRTPPINKHDAYQADKIKRYDD